MAVKKISLVMPAYKQEKTIIKDVRNISRVLSGLPYRHEIIIVVDGNLDNTFKKLKKIKSRKIKVFG